MDSTGNLHSSPPPAYSSTFPIPPPPTAAAQLSKRRVLLAKFIKHFTSKRVLIILLIGLVVACVELVYGHKYDDECPYRPQIALFLTVQGIVKLVSCCTVIIAYIQARFLRNYKYLYELMLVNIAIHLVFATFFLAWFILGNVWIWTVNTSVIQSSDPTQTSTYCDDQLYQTAKRLLIVHYIIIGIVFLIVVGRRICIRHTKQETNQVQQETIPAAVQNGDYELQQKW
jgi:hypothetical protein